jgi:hypothetical protein
MYLALIVTRRAIKNKGVKNNTKKSKKKHLFLQFIL